MSGETKEEIERLAAELEQIEAERREIEAERQRLEVDKIERIEVAKLRANSLDRASTATVSVCLLTPALHWILTPPALQGFQRIDLFMVLLVCVLLAFALHSFAVSVLKSGLKA